jgi:TPR repeat protein
MSCLAIIKPLRAIALEGTWLAAASFAIALPACAQHATLKVDSASQAAGGSPPPFSLEPGRPEEQFELALRYESGNGVDGDDAWAEYWAWRSALQGNDPAREWLRRRAYAEPIDQSAIVVIDVLNHFKRRAYPSAQLWLALSGPDPKDGSENRREAIELVEEALPVVHQRALRGDIWAKYLVGAVEDFAFSDWTEARRWYAEAAELGNVLAQDSLGHLYEEGRGGPTDGAEAARWFQAAAAQGYARSESMLGWLYDNGLGVAQNPQEAMHWYLKAAQQGMVFAQNKLGSLYATGRGVARDENEALRWYRAAVQGGSTEAAQNIRLVEARAKAHRAPPPSEPGTPEPGSPK